ncbi:tetratricopeptide repeat protein [Spongiactinospora gelatinilytica]|uniref:tetratricopeptide repeat protein n=1 Tax=Spongiactinospora gelatinilytica TaxID=2666298 RepID=UPI0011B93907|nr:tetratricopeptide repeat protein [Spongiactinospora gelatinilytica]
MVGGVAVGDGRRGGEFAVRLAELVQESGLTLERAAAKTMARCPRDASWTVTFRQISAWQNGDHLPGAEAAFLTLVRVLTEHARGRARRGHRIGELLDEPGWARLLRQARARRPAETGGGVRRPAAGVHELKPRPLRLAGRAALLTRLHHAFAEPSDTPVQIVLHGLGGIGKTSLAVEFAHRVRSGHGLIWQFAAEDHTALAGGFAALAVRLRLPDDGGGPVAQVHTALAEADRPWLLVLDNVTDHTAIRGWLPAAGPGKLLITSRSAHWPLALGIEVTPPEIPAAARFLLDRTGQDDGVAAAAVATELGALPLALEQAGAFISTAGLSLAEYLDGLRARRDVLLYRGEPYDYAGSVASTWTLAFQRLERDAPDAIALLRLLSRLAPDDVPIRTLLAGRRTPLPDSLDLTELAGLAGDPIRIAEAVAELRRYSLVASPEPGVLSVHRLVQAVTADRMSPSARAAWRSAAAALIEDALPGRPDLVANRPLYARLVPHAHVALEPSARGMREIVDYLAALGDYQTAARVQGEIHADVLGRLGPEHPDTLTAAALRAVRIGQAGDPATARDLLAALLPLRERVSGGEHPDTLWLVAALTEQIGQAGSPGVARDRALELLPLRKRVSGPDDPDTIRLAHQIAFWTGQAGDAEAARVRYEEFLPRMERIWGAEHPDTLAARDQYARFLGESGAAEAALKACTSLLSAHERISGPEHPDTLWARSNLAFRVGEAGDPAGARDLFAALVPDCERISGLESHVALVARVFLAHWTGRAGDPVAARDQCEAVLAVRVRRFPPEHFDTLVVREYAARWTGEAGDPHGAASRYAALLTDVERVFGPESALTHRVRDGLAYWTSRTRL